ncbi:MAG TPA: nucleotidyltransferase family protein [Pyrinomonadaceae bacterium]|jgi:molybdenum cofactor cytidylyltransferase
MRIEKPKIGVIVLAAGGSKRMNGEPKQLLIYRGKTLLRRAVETAVQAKFETVAVVFGANPESLKKEIDDLPAKVLINKNWETGLGSSIKTGLSALSTKSLDAVIITLCDQPLISTETLQNLVEVFARARPLIAAAKYAETIGVPALFASEIFDELMSLPNDAGAKRIINKYKKHKEKIVLVSAQTAEFDVDTFEDYEKLTLFY